MDAFILKVRSQAETRIDLVGANLPTEGLMKKPPVTGSLIIIHSYFEGLKTDSRN